MEVLSEKLVIPEVFSKSGIQGYKIFLDRYTLKAEKGDLDEGDMVLVVTKRDPKFPQKEIGWVREINGRGAVVDLATGGGVYEDFDLISKPLETTPEEVVDRVANALAESEDDDIRGHVAEDFKKILLDYFIPGGRILAGAGAPGGNLTLSNCFVLPGPKDSRKGIMHRVTEMAETHSRGGGVGVNLSTLRPRYAKVVGVNGVSSGAVSWGEMFDLSTGLIEQAGSRRGATMLMIDDWHPDVEEFIEAKRQVGKFENANMSVCISDGFMEAVKNDEQWDLIFPDTTDPDYDSKWNGDLNAWKKMGKKVNIYKTIRAKEIWDKLIFAAWNSAEPGLHFLERSNKMSNSFWFSPLVGTNPCAEQPLEEYGVCTLGAIDLSKFYDENDIDWQNLHFVVTNAVRLLDNVITANNYHLDEIKETHESNRRIGFGTMGLGELLIKLGIRYGSDECVKFLDKLYGFIATAAYLASSYLAEEKGSFPKFDTEKYLESGFMKSMPDSVKESITRRGMRNVCVLTQAPTGTTGTMMGTSTGIEPFFNWEYTRTSRLGVHKEIVPIIEELGLDIKNLPDYCVTAHDLSPQEHIKVQAIIQRWTDSAISKTTNCPADFTLEQTDELYRSAYNMGCKGITIYRDQSRDEQVLRNIEEEEDGVELIHEGACVRSADGSFSKCDI